MKLVCWFAVFMIVAMSGSISFGQGRDRVIDRPPNSQPSAVEVGEGGRFVSSSVDALRILQFKVNGETVELGKPFSADADWLKSLTVKVKNTGGKPISSIRINFSLPETRSDDWKAGFSLEYGKALSTGIDYGVQRAILPGEELDLVRNEEHHTRDREGIARRTGISDFIKVFLISTVVRFEDGSVWSQLTNPLPVQ